MTTGTYISGKEIFLPALLVNAASIIIVHNHPGQDPTPSQTDKEFTLMMSFPASRLLYSIKQETI